MVHKTEQLGPPPLGKSKAMKFFAIALFCEDIREEKSGQYTIVGILPDSLNVQRVPAVLPKLGIYLRFHLNTASKFRTIKATLRVPGGKNIPLAEVHQKLLAELRTKALSSGTPFAGLVYKTFFSPFGVSAAGRLEVVAEINGAYHICGVLNITPVPPEQSENTSQLFSSISNSVTPEGD
jgi:hypothetical protein